YTTLFRSEFIRIPGGEQRQPDHGQLLYCEQSKYPHRDVHLGYLHPKRHLTPDVDERHHRELRQSAWEPGRGRGGELPLELVLPGLGQRLSFHRSIHRTRLVVGECTWGVASRHLGAAKSIGTEPTLTKLRNRSKQPAERGNTMLEFALTM